jgi:Ca-activated chloride channel family protein
MEERAKKDSIALVTKDSLSADSIAKSIMVIPSDTPSMEGYATNNLVFLLDISSSMNTPEKLPLLKDAMKYLLDLMREEDKITLITYSTKAELLLPPTSALLKDSILNAINQLQTEGVSNANVGINLAYTIAQKAYIPNGNNRIILATDGGFKVEKKIKKKIKKGSKQREKTYLSVFYFSAKEFNHNKVFLEEIARWGKGKYSYIEPENVEETLLREAQAVRKK